MEGRRSLLRRETMNEHMDCRDARGSSVTHPRGGPLETNMTQVFMAAVLFFVGLRAADELQDSVSANRPISSIVWALCVAVIVTADVLLVVEIYR